MHLERDSNLTLEQPLTTEIKERKTVTAEETLSSHYPVMSGARFTAAKKLQALREQILKDKYISEELAYYVAPNGQSFPSSDASEPLQPWMHKEFLQSDVRVLLLKGAGGAGKSTFNCQLMRQLWQDKAWAEWKPGSAPPSKAFVPVFIPLGSSQVDPKRLLAYLGDLPAPLESFTEEEINVLKADYQLLLIADGYDEIPGQLHLNLYDVNDLDKYAGRIKLLISSRILEGRERVENSQFVPHCHGSESILEWRYYKERYMSPFSDDQIADYFRQYLTKNKDRTDITLWPDVESYQKQFTALPELRALITTPFLLWMTAEVLPSIARDVEDTLVALPDMPDTVKEKKEKEDSSSPKKERKIRVKDDDDSKDKTVTSTKHLEKQQQRHILTRAKLYHHFMAQWFTRQAQKAVATKDFLQDPEALLGSEVVQSASSATGDILAAELLKLAYIRFCQTFASQLQAESRVSVQYPVESKRRGRLGHHETELTPPATTPTLPAWVETLFGSRDPDWLRVHKGCPLLQNASNERQFLHASLIDYFVITIITEQATIASVVEEVKEKTFVSREDITEEEALLSTTPTTASIVNIESCASKMSLPPTEEPEILTTLTIPSIPSITPVRRKRRLGTSSEGKESDLITQRLLPRNTIQLSADDLKENNERSKFLRTYYDGLIEQSKTDEKAAIGAANAITVFNAAGENFSSRNYCNIRIPGADLSGALLDRTNFIGADLTNVSLQGAWLSNACLQKTNLSDVQFGQQPDFNVKEWVNKCVFSPDGRRLAVGTGGGEILDEKKGPYIQPGSILLFDVQTRNVLQIFKVDKDMMVNSLAWDSKGERLASSASSKFNSKIQIWEVETGKELQCLSSA